MVKKRRLRAKNRMGVVVPYDIAADDVTMANGNNLEQEIKSIKNGSLQIFISGNQLVFAGSTTPVLNITAAQASVPKGGSATIRVEGHNLEGNVTLTIASGSGFSFESGSSVLTKTITMIDATAGVDVPVYFDGTEVSTAVIVATSENATAASVSISGTVLPSAYTALEYISGATNGVRPGIASIGSRWELVLQCVAAPSSSQIIICSDAYPAHFAEALSSGVWGLLGEGYNTTIPVTQKSVITVEFTQKGIIMSVGGQTVQKTNETRDNYETVCLFQENSTTNFTYTGKVFSAKCLQGGNFYGVPCKRNSDNKEGLYDLANNVFYPIK